MHPMAILGIALGVGLVVYALSLGSRDETFTLQPMQPESKVERRLRRRRQEPRAIGFGPEPPPPPGESFVYVPVDTSPDTWRTRLSGLVGLIAFVVISASVLAVAVWQVGHMINQIIVKFLGK